MSVSNQALPPSVTRLVDALTQLPGIGPKSASRLAYFLLRAPLDVSMGLSEALRDLKARTRLCSSCFNITESDPCGICGDGTRDRRIICVVEEPLDVIALERARSYKGLYHVLHGVISPVSGVMPEDLKLAELLNRLSKADPPIQEVILALNPTMEGDMTVNFIQKKLVGLGLPGPVRVTRLARGLPSGGDLEYADEITLSRALEGRQQM